jgi:hypothetical protein
MKEVTFMKMNPRGDRASFVAVKSQQGGASARN